MLQEAGGRRARVYAAITALNSGDCCGGSEGGCFES